jgi:hypothetical protein
MWLVSERCRRRWWRGTSAGGEGPPRLAAFFIHGFSPCLSPLIQQRRRHRVRRRPRRCRSRRRPPCWQRSGRRTQWSPDPANAAETRPGRSGRTSPPSCHRGSRTARSRPHAVGRRPRRSPPSHAPPLLRSLCGRTVTSVPAVDLGRTLRGRGETRRAWRRGALRRRPIHGPRRSGADLGAGCKIWGGCAPRLTVRWAPTDSARRTGNTRGAGAGSAPWSPRHEVFRTMSPPPKVQDPRQIL